MRPDRAGLLDSPQGSQERVTQAACFRCDRRCTSCIQGSGKGCAIRVPVQPLRPGGIASRPCVAVGTAAGSWDRRLSSNTSKEARKGLERQANSATWCSELPMSCRRPRSASRVSTCACRLMGPCPSSKRSSYATPRHARRTSQGWQRVRCFRNVSDNPILSRSGAVATGAVELFSRFSRQLLIPRLEYVESQSPRTSQTAA